MTGDYRDRLFATYSKTHLAFLDSDDRIKLDWFLEYARGNYLKFIDKFDRESATILEIGCNKGYLLSALGSFGFRNLFGVDLSPDDVEKAKVLVPNADVACADAFDYLDDNPRKFDIIILKAVLEHVQKDKVFPLLERIREGLKPGGVVIIDVPNMDWLFASHERYMDFTHEIGFTKESLRQVMNCSFSDVEVMPVDNISSLSSTDAIKIQIARFILGRLLFWADPQGGDNPIWARNIVGVGKE